MKKLTQEQVNDMIVLHEDWLENVKKGKRADFSNTDLRYIHLGGANLKGANFTCANLEFAILRHTNLQHCNLEGAILKGANLRDVNLFGAYLRYANLEDADLKGANLLNANLRYANLEDADLKGANLLNANLEGVIRSGFCFKGSTIDDTYNRDESVSNKKVVSENDFIVDVLEKNGTDLNEIRELYQKMKTYKLI